MSTPQNLKLAGPRCTPLTSPAAGRCCERPRPGSHRVPLPPYTDPSGRLPAGGVVLPAFYGLITDWWWFREIGYQIVFTRELSTRVVLFLAAGGLTAGVLYLNLRAAQRGLVPNPIVLRIAPTAPHLNLTAAFAA